MPDRLPTYALAHGGGPWPWMENAMGVDWQPLRDALAAIPSELPSAPRAIVMISAHWEEDDFRLQTSARPPMLYDYWGFPEHTYSIDYPAPGAPDVAAEVAQLLDEHGIPTSNDPDRGFDHGTFVPMHVMYPEADVPLVQLSIRRDYDPAAHLALGRALAPLRDRGVLLVASGLPSFHDLSTMGPASAGAAKAFDDWLTETMVEHSGDDRSARLLEWDRAPSARQAHPREDHFIPLLVAVGAAEGDTGVRQYHEDDSMGGWMASSGYRLG